MPKRSQEAVPPPLHMPRRNTWRRKLAVVALVCCVAGAALVMQRVTSAEAACAAYIVQRGDTLSRIGGRYHVSLADLARWNSIRNVNLIYVGQRLCVSDGRVISDPLEWSTPQQVHQLLIKAADQHQLPRALVLAIAWQESNWTQHVIAWDGGVGTMQLMPYTTDWLNATLHTHLNAYRLADNIALGTNYLRMLMNEFRGDLSRVISAYNEGSRNVRTRGIFNWRYVNSVYAHMRWIA